MELAGGFARNEGENEAEAKNSKNTAHTHTHNKKVKDALLTPVIELVQLNLTESLGEEKPYLPKGARAPR